MTKLFEQRKQILKAMEDKGYTRGPFRMRPRRVIENHALLIQQLEQVDDHIAQMRDYYVLHLLESLGAESKKLSELTQSLIVESKKLTKLTKVLIYITALLAVFALPPFVGMLVAYLHL